MPGQGYHRFHLIPPGQPVPSAPADAAFTEWFNAITHEVLELRRRILRLERLDDAKESTT